MLPPFVRKYLLTALSGTPDVLDAFLKAIPDDDPVWDFRPDPERFTLREVLAHLADWEPIFLERMTRIRTENDPELHSYDEGQIALERDYAHQSPQANLRRFREGRAPMLTFLRSLDLTDWQRTGRYFMENLVTEKDHSPGIGGRGATPASGIPITLEAWMAQVAGHDGYHMQQVPQWLAAAKA